VLGKRRKTFRRLGATRCVEYLDLRATVTGVFISRGMTVAVPPGGLTIGFGSDGKMTGNLNLHVRFDVCPTWIQLALAHLKGAMDCRTARQAAWATPGNDVRASTLEREFEASMQAIMAVAIAIDAFYATLQPNVAIPESMLTRWREKRTARYSQVTETVRRAFNLTPKNTSVLRANLKDVYHLRDLAVHPSGKIEAPILHPELGVGVEWRFAYFRAQIAELVVHGATGILWELAHKGKTKDPKIREYLATLRSRLAELFPNGHPKAAAAPPSPP
jgi:hypothetical protein